MNIKKVLVGIAAGSLVLAGFATSAFAKTSHTNFGQQVNASACDTTSSPVLNVTYSVLNDSDSGVAGNVWANDNYSKSVQVWPQADGIMCAVVRYTGQFVTFPGLSPENTGTVGAGVQGTFQGGYVATFNGTLASDLQTNGDLGVKDYACNGTYTCPGLFDWAGTYFPGYSNFAQSYWGWDYQGGNNGSWVNAITGNSGDITGI